MFAHVHAMVSSTMMAANLCADFPHSIPANIYLFEGSANRPSIVRFPEIVYLPNPWSIYTPTNTMYMYTCPMG